jgi:hypothetical protein
MRHIKVENNIPTEYSLEQLFIDYPDAVIYKKSQMPDEELLANYNVYPLVTTPLPTDTDDTILIIGEGIPVFQNGEWYQTWITRPLTEEEIIEKLKQQEAITSTNLDDILANISEVAE